MFTVYVTQQTAHLYAQGVMAFKCVLKCYQLLHKAVRCFQHDLCCSLSLITIDDIDVLSSLEGKVLILTFGGVRVPTLHWYPQKKKKILTLCFFFFQGVTHVARAHVNTDFDWNIQGLTSPKPCRAVAITLKAIETLLPFNYHTFIRRSVF